MDAVDPAFAPETAVLEAVTVTPKQSEMRVIETALAWVPVAPTAG